MKKIFIKTKNRAEKLAKSNSSAYTVVEVLAILMVGIALCMVVGTFYTTIHFLLKV